jgi:hypothetical protein
VTIAVALNQNRAGALQVERWRKSYYSAKNPDLTAVNSHRMMLPILPTWSSARQTVSGV